jgi:hypothetical protein
MTRSWWKRATSVGLLLSAFSLPVWGGNHEKDKVGDHDDPKKFHKDPIPEGGPFYTYVVLSGLVIVGGVWVAYKRSSNRGLSKS